jgi:hypothetical protein
VTLRIKASAPAPRRCRDDFLRFSTKIFSAGNSGSLRIVGGSRGARRFDSDAFIRHFIACMRALQNCARRSPQTFFDPSAVADGDRACRSFCNERRRCLVLPMRNPRCEHDRKSKILYRDQGLRLRRSDRRFGRACVRKCFQTRRVCACRENWIRSAGSLARSKPACATCAGRIVSTAAVCCSSLRVMAAMAARLSACQRSRMPRDCRARIIALETGGVGIDRFCRRRGIRVDRRGFGKIRSCLDLVASALRKEPITLGWLQD